MGRFSSSVVVGSLFALASALPQRNIEARASTVYDFADIPVTKELEWVSCFENYTCTNLEVPLDYADESAGTTNIAFLKVTGGDGTGPDILFNPGGPGGSGTDSVRSLAESIWGIFGENYNLIGFDPRGVNNSGPTATCFSDSDSRDSSSIMFAAGINAPLQEVYARTRAATESCSLVNKDSDLGYIGTSAVAQDMRYFIELQATSNGKPADEAKLWYYGVSYGTVIGQTFAALFPDRIERMILDGNVNSEFYYNGLVSSSLTDSDKAIRSFFEYCAEAGPEKCAFAGNDTHGQLLTSEEQLEARFNNLLKKLEEEPLIVVDASFPDIITDYSVRNWVFNQAYGANVRFPYMALALAELDSGNATGFQQIQSLLRGSPATSEVHSSNVEPNPFYAEEEGLLLVTCVDIAGRSPVKTFKDFLPIFYQLSSTSVYYGEGLAKGNGLMCSGFDVPPPESQLFPGFTEATTSTPILFVNFLRDPITPATNADSMSKYFPRSVVLKQNATGHGMMAATSKCTADHVKAYLADATLPKSGTVCESDEKPFFPKQ